MTERNRMAQSAVAFLDLPPERLIAFSRLILALVALVAITLDPTQPAEHPVLTEALLVAYVVFAAALAVATVVAAPGPRTVIAVHASDIAVFAVLVALTQGPTSPFFVFFTFALFAATLRWNWRGAMATAAVLVPLFVLLGVLYVPGADAPELMRGIIRGGYLMVTAALLAYFGMIRERARQRLAQLADWPPETVADGAFPPVKPPLLHALKVLGAGRALACWELDEEPWLWLAACDGEGCELHREPPAETPIVPEALAGRSFLVLDADRGHYWVRGARRMTRERQLGARLLAECGASRAVVAPIRGEGFSGHILLIDVAPASEVLLPLAEVVAARIGSEIQHHLLRRALEAATAVRERARLARDMHDGLLQSLTAAALQVKAMRNQAPEALRPKLDALQRMVGSQQRRLREFVECTRGQAAAERSVEDELAPVLAEVEAQWDCATALAVEPPDAAVSRELGAELALMVTEAAANAARHGGASSIEVKVTHRGDSLRLQIEDDGRGLKGAGTRGCDQAVPRSLHERARELGGDVRVAASRRGLRLQIEVAVP